MSQNIKPQKALHLFQEADKKKPKFTGHHYMMLEKHDGWYGFLDFPSCKIHSRAMREIPSLVELSNTIRAKRPQIKGRLIFEIMIDGLEIDSFYELNGILNRKYEQVDDVYLRVHDYLPDFKFDMPAHKRYKFAEEVVRRLELPNIVRMSKFLGSSVAPTTWQVTAERVWAKGGEGVILKRCEGIYMPEKRNFELMKIKEELTLDLQVIDKFEGDGKYAGTLGGLIVIDSHEIKHRVSGMTDAQRDAWWKRPEAIINKVVEIKAMKRLKDGSLREPRFKAIRYDKSISEID
tara:strand:+ start:1209 stop:2081 length:873 start_codon:yes stop_codon:yes gene_type:complete